MAARTHNAVRCRRSAKPIKKCFCGNVSNSCNLRAADLINCRAGVITGASFRRGMDAPSHTPFDNRRARPTVDYINIGASDGDIADIAVASQSPLTTSSSGYRLLRSKNNVFSHPATARRPRTLWCRDLKYLHVFYLYWLLVLQTELAAYHYLIDPGS